MSAPQVVVFGEVLFDVFPDGRSVLGGAPFNVACHARGLGLTPVFVSRVGEDDAGRAVVQAMEARSMPLAGLQRDAEHPTGQVTVTFENGQPSYEIEQGAAWDFIEADPALTQSVEPAARIVYHGSLAARSEVSRATLRELTARPADTVVCDLNLRPPWFSDEGLEPLLTRADHLKLNDEELAYLGRAFGLGAGKERELAASVLERFTLETLAVTLGERGALLLTAAGEEHVVPARPPQTFMDPVGAGDAFCAVLLTGIARKLPWPDVLETAAALAGMVCGLRGALPQPGSPDATIYQQALSIGGLDHVT